MSILNLGKCPKCKIPFPYFIPFSNRIKRGIFLSPYVKCSNCGQLCHTKVDWKKALWIYPLTIIILALEIYCLRNIVWFKKIYHFSSALYGGLCGALFGLTLSIGLRSGAEFIEVKKNILKNPQHYNEKYLIIIIFVLIFCICLGFITGKWMSIILMTGVSLLILMILHIFLYKKSK